MKNDSKNEEVNTIEVGEDKLVVHVPSVLISDDNFDEITIMAANTNYYTTTHSNGTNCCSCDKC